MEAIWIVVAVILFGAVFDPRKWRKKKERAAQKFIDRIDRGFREDPWQPLMPNAEVAKRFNTEAYDNNKYTVVKYDCGHYWHLWIVHRNMVFKFAVTRNWMDFQRIKNQICGEEQEGIEIYPKQSRLIDAANAYHLFVVKDYEFPFTVADHPDHPASETTLQKEAAARGQPTQEQLQTMNDKLKGNDKS